MVARQQMQCIMMQGVVSDKNRRCSVDQTVPFNRSFGSPVADAAVAGILRMQPLNWDTAIGLFQVSHSSPLTCFDKLLSHLLQIVQEYTWIMLRTTFSTGRLCSHISNELTLWVKSTRVRSQVPNVKLDLGNKTLAAYISDRHIINKILKIKK